MLLQGICNRNFVKFGADFEYIINFAKVQRISIYLWERFIVFIWSNNIKIIMLSRITQSFIKLDQWVTRFS